ncbi:protein LDOC1-like [Ambystoma mexicanum]|uniref:protein LDOC1-like n=1 Tax=Ambystoma mexicanum TaxID=8296 RepID=UPI0037E72330
MDPMQEVMRSLQELTLEVQTLKAENAALKQMVLTRDMMAQENPPLGAALEKYDGSPKKLQDFLDSYTIQFTFRPTLYATERAKVGFLIPYLTGNALTWATPYVTGTDPLLDNYTILVNAFRNMFDKPDIAFSAQESLLDLQKGSMDVLSYTSKFRQLANETG